jgi:hypothetical protein
MNINSLAWPLGAKLADVGTIAVILGGTTATAVVKTSSSCSGRDIY